MHMQQNPLVIGENGNRLRANNNVGLCIHLRWNARAARSATTISVFFPRWRSN